MSTSTFGLINETSFPLLHSISHGFGLGSPPPFLEHEAQHKSYMYSTLKSFSFNVMMPTLHTRCSNIPRALLDSSWLSASRRSCTCRGSGSCTRGPGTEWARCCTAALFVRSRGTASGMVILTGAGARACFLGKSFRRLRNERQRLVCGRSYQRS